MPKGVPRGRNRDDTEQCMFADVCHDQRLPCVDDLLKMLAAANLAFTRQIIRAPNACGDSKPGCVRILMMLQFCCIHLAVTPFL